MTKTKEEQIDVCKAVLQETEDCLKVVHDIDQRITAVFRAEYAVFDHVIDLQNQAIKRIEGD